MLKLLLERLLTNQDWNKKNVTISHKIQVVLDLFMKSMEFSFNYFCLNLKK